MPFSLWEKYLKPILTMFTFDTRNKAKISVNKLAEYVDASPLRRRSIVGQQKNPDPFIVTRYTRAREGFVSAIINSSRQLILDAKAAIAATPTSTEFQESDKVTSIEALDCFDNITFPDLEGFTLVPFAGDGRMDIKGVDVSVYPDIIIRGTYRGTKFVGGIKLHIVKTTTLSKEGRLNVATVLQQFLEEKVAEEDETVLPKFCFSIDVFAGECQEAPTSIKRRREQIYAACEEYKLWWDSL